MGLVLDILKRITPLQHIENAKRDIPIIKKKIEQTAPRVTNFIRQNPTPIGFAKKTLVPVQQEIQRNQNEYMKNRYIKPVVAVKDIPGYVKTGMDKSKDWKERGLALGQAGLTGAGAIATVFPDPIGDIALPVWDAYKGVRAGIKEKKSVKDILKRGVQSLTLEKPVGMGDAFGKTKTQEDIGNLAELPLMLMAGVVRPKSLKEILTNKKVIAKNADSIVTEIVNGFKRYSRKTDPARAETAVKARIDQLGPEAVIKTWYKAKAQGKEQIKAFWNHLMPEAPGDYNPKPSVIENLTETARREAMIDETKKLQQNPVPESIGVTGGVGEIFKRTTEIENYDPLLSGKPIKGKVGEVIEMTPDEYLAQIPKSNPTQSSIDFMKKKLAKGEQLPMTILDYSGGGFTQEGRNRAYLAKELGIEKMPVLKVTDIGQGEVGGVTQPVIPKEVPVPKPVEAPIIPPQVTKSPVMAPIQPQAPISAVEHIRTLKPQEQITDVTDARTSFKTARDMADDEYSNIFKDAEDLGYTSKDIFDANEGKIPVTPEMEKLLARHNALTNELRLTSGKKDIGELANYMPHESKTAIDTELRKIFGNTIIDKVNELGGHLMKRKGTLTDYSKDYLQVMHNYTEQMLVNRYKNWIDVMEKPPAIAKATKELAEQIEKQESPFEFSTIASGKTTKTLDKIDEIANTERKVGSTLSLEDAEFYRRMGYKNPIDIPPAEKIKIKEKINLLQYTLQDAYTQFKNTGIWKDAFERLDHAEQKAAYIINTQIEPLLKNKDLNGIMKIIQQYTGTGIEYSSISQKLLWLWRNGQYDTFSYNIKKMIHAAEQKVGEKILLDFLKTHEFESGLLKNAADFATSRLLGRQKVIKTFTDKVLNFINQRFASGYLGLSPTAVINNLFEIKRGNALTDPKSFAIAMKEAITNLGAMRKKYGYATDTSFKGQFQKGKTILDKADDVVLTPFAKSEAMKDDMILAIAEGEAKKQGLQGEQLFQFVTDFYEKYAIKFNNLARIGMFNNKWVNTALQFSQYALKDLNIYADKFSYIKGTNAAKKKEALKYVTKIMASNVILWTFASKVLGYNSMAADNIWMSVPGWGPLITGIKNAIDEYNYTNADLVQRGEDSSPVSTMKEMFRRGGKTLRTATAFVVPAGNQIFNRTGASIKLQTEGAKESASGRIQYMAPTSAVEKARGLILGPYNNPQPSEYYDKTKKREWSSLGENQSKTIKDMLAAGDVEGANALFRSYRDVQEKKFGDKKMLRELETGKVVTDIDKPITSNAISSQPTSVSEMLKAQKERNARITDIQNILSRTTERYENIPNDEKRTQVLLDAIGATPEEVQDAQYKSIRNMDLKPQADIVWGMLQEKQMDMTTMYEKDLLTASVAKQWEREGKIEDADSLIDKLKMTDVYEQRKYNRKQTQKLITKRLAINKSMSAKLRKVRKNASAKATAEMKKLSTKRTSIRSMFSKKLASMRPKNTKGVPVQTYRKSKLSIPKYTYK